MRFCTDGTIRDIHNQCLEAIPDLDSQNILTDCESGNTSQQFQETSIKKCADNLGNEQNCLALYNVGADQCVGNDGGSADGGAANSCEHYNMWRSKMGSSEAGRI